MKAILVLTAAQLGLLLSAGSSPAGTWGQLANPGFTDKRIKAALRNKNSILGIQCFIPEIFSSPPDTVSRLSWKRDFSRRWFESGIPFLMDVSPGYDAHGVFTNSTYYGYTQFWLDSLTQLVNDYGQAGMVCNSWNGYTEGMVAVPTVEDGAIYYNWLQSLNSTRAIYVDHSYVGAEYGTATQPFRTVGSANTAAFDGDRIQVRSGSYNETLTFGKMLTVDSQGGQTTIGK